MLPRPSLHLYSEGLVEGASINTQNLRCLSIRSFDAVVPDPKKPATPLKANAYYGTAQAAPMSVDSFCYDAQNRLVAFRSFIKDKDGMRSGGINDVTYTNTDTGTIQVVNYPDLPGTTVTTLFRNGAIVWSQTYGRGMMAVEERHSQEGTMQMVRAKSFIMPWHLKRTEEPTAGGGLHTCTFVPRGNDTTTASIQIADYDAQHQPLVSYTLTPRPQRDADGQVVYDTSNYIAYHYDKAGRLTAIGDTYKMEYEGKETWPARIEQQTAKGSVHWQLRYKMEAGRPAEVLMYERLPLPKSAKGSAYYYELRKKFTVGYHLQ